MLLSLALVGAGLVLLIAGGEFLVRGASALALRLGVSPLLIGLTVVGFGTSTPELVTSVQAALIGSSGIAVGNIVGSNIANILLILGVAALIMPIPCGREAVLRDGTIVLGVALAFAAVAAGGAYGRPAGLAAMVLLVLYLALVVHRERRSQTAGGEEEAASAPMPWPAVAALVLGGLATVILGGRLLVDGSVDLARLLGVSETLIGLTVVAVGTSLPELVTSVIAALRRQPELALGNILGSNIYNVLFIGGVTAAIEPGVAIPDRLIAFDAPVMLAASLALIVVAATGWRISRLEGLALLAGYGAYTASLAINA